MTTPPKEGEDGPLVGRINSAPGSPLEVGAMDVTVRRVGDATAAGRHPFSQVFRPEVNHWIAVAGDLNGPRNAVTAVLGELARSVHATGCEAVSPSTLVKNVQRLVGEHGPPTDSGNEFGVGVVVAGIELHADGAWVTSTGIGHVLSMVLRHVGWVDIRARSFEPWGSKDEVPYDDRVDLGPGDTLVLTTEVMGRNRDAEGIFLVDKILPDVLVDQRGRSSDRIADSLVDAMNDLGAASHAGNGVVMVLRVPESVRHEGLQWVMRSTGAAPENVRPPGYAMQPQPDEAHGPVDRPREALIRLAPEPPSVPALRSLLRRLFQSWRMDALAAEGDLELLATEVATSAFSRSASPVTVIVRYTGPVVRVEVGDGERQVSQKRRLEFGGLHGHRLSLVESLATGWGVSTTSTGSRMWFEVAVPNPD